jgi:hypothetical protein
MNQNLKWTPKFSFRCRHGKMSRPFTCSPETYEVCLDCGTHFPYSQPRQGRQNEWNQRRIQRTAILVIDLNGMHAGGTA